MFPIFLDLTDRLSLVVGGGQVGQRKARALLDAGSLVRLVCLEPQNEEMQHPRLIWLCEQYSPDHFAGVSLAFAAAYPQLNCAVVAEAKRRGIWVSSASDPAAGDFVLPATFRRGQLTVGVSTGGASPTLAARIRDRLQSHLEDSVAVWIELLQIMRPLVLEQISEADRRHELLEKWSDWSWLERLQAEGREAVQVAWLAELSEWARC